MLVLIVAYMPLATVVVALLLPLGEQSVRRTACGLLRLHA